MLNPAAGKVKRSLKVSFWDGFFASCTVGFTTDYVAPFALALQATTRQIGALTAFPFLASSFAQLKSAEITERLKSRKKTAVIFTFIHTFMLLPIIFLPYLFKAHQVWFLIFFFTLLTGFGVVCVPAMSSIIVDYVPKNKRGKYFGWRNQSMMAVIITCSLIAGFILHALQRDVLKGFMIIFCLAFLCRFISWYFITRLYEPPLRLEKTAYFSFLDFLKHAKESNFAKFALFVSSIHFSVNLAAPFFSVYMLRELKFDYITYTVMVTAVTTASIFTMGRWGRSADKVGNVKVLRLTALFIASLPLWWLINQNPVFLIFPQALSGIAWAGFNLCTGNFVFDAVTAQKRIRCLAYLNVCVGIAIFLGSILGGYLVNILPQLLGSKILMLFLISCALRFIMVFALASKIKEVRHTAEVSGMHLLFNVLGTKKF